MIDKSECNACQGKTTCKHTIRLKDIVLCKVCKRLGPIPKRLNPHMGQCGTCGRTPEERVKCKEI